MRARDLINYMIPPLRPTDSVDKASRWMEELRLTELPVAEGEDYLGIITEEMLFSDTQNGSCVSDFVLEGKECQVEDSRHFYEVLRTAYYSGNRIIGVTDDEKRYLGAISVEDIVEAFAETSSIKNAGAILVISTNVRDYYLSEISRLVESADTKIISSYIVTDQEDPSQLTLTIKINKEETSYVIPILENNGYQVIESFSESPASIMEKDRLGHLMNFLKL